MVGGPPELELFPLSVRLLKHQIINQRTNQVTSFSGMMGGIGGMVVSKCTSIAGTCIYILKKPIKTNNNLYP
jgi:ubiquitin carboxyl-terminal hydrolase 6/32